jgi:hypothetical protein
MKRGPPAAHAGAGLAYIANARVDRDNPRLT